MNKKTILVISNIFFGLTIAVSFVVSSKIYFLYKKLPVGVCPVENYKPWIYGTIVLAIITLITSFLAER
ncbi:MAG: hypothetical protein ACOYVD_15775 [Bacillota bacterium]